MSQHPQHQRCESGAAQWNSAIVCFVIYSRDFLSITKNTA